MRIFYPMTINERNNIGTGVGVKYVLLVYLRMIIKKMD
jgi:hypothetical protein